MTTPDPVPHYLYLLFCRRLSVRLGGMAEASALIASFWGTIPNISEREGSWSPWLVVEPQLLDSVFIAQREEESFWIFIEPILQTTSTSSCRSDSLFDRQAASSSSPPEPHTICYAWVYVWCGFPLSSLCHIPLNRIRMLNESFHPKYFIHPLVPCVAQRMSRGEM